MTWSTSELRVRLAPLNRFKPSSKIFYWPFQGGTSFVDLLCFCSVLCLLYFVRVCLYVLCGHLLGKGWLLGYRLWCLLWVCHFPIGILGQVWYLIVSIPDLCNLITFMIIKSYYDFQDVALLPSSFMIIKSFYDCQDVCNQEVVLWLLSHFFIVKRFYDNQVVLLIPWVFMITNRFYDYQVTLWLSRGVVLWLPKCFMITRKSNNCLWIEWFQVGGGGGGGGYDYTKIFFVLINWFYDH